MFDTLKPVLLKELDNIREAGLYKNERIITSPQGARITVQGMERPVLNFCANNYLGLSSHPKVVEAVQQNLARMRADWPAYLDEFFTVCFSEPHSTKPYEDAVREGRYLVAVETNDPTPEMRAILDVTGADKVEVRAD